MHFLALRIAKLLGFMVSMPYFFKQCWDIVWADLVEAVQDIFVSGCMVQVINITYVTLILRVHNPNKVSDYRPISYCSTLYKAISKVLTCML